MKSAGQPRWFPRQAMAKVLAGWLMLIGSVFEVVAALAPPVSTPAGGLVHTPAAVSLASVDSDGLIFYTIDGPDPRSALGGVHPQARVYRSVLSVNRSMVVRARVRRDNEWSEMASAAFTADQDFSKLLFTELMFHPRDTADRAEFIELKNVGAAELDISELTLKGGGCNYAFPAGSVVGPGEFMVLIHNLEAFRALHPDAPVHGVFQGNLSNSEDSFTIEGADSGVAASAGYETAAPWQVVPDNHGYFEDGGVGFSLVRTTLDPAADPADYRNWRASAQRFGSPGADDPPASVPAVYITELLTRGSADVLDALEFFNPNDQAVDIGGWWLSDERNQPFQYQIPPGTIISPHGYLVLTEDQFGDEVSFRSEGERCYLFSADAEGVLTGYSHGFQFLGSERDVSFGRHLASDGSEDFPLQLSPTFGGENSGPSVPPVVVNEFMYRTGAVDESFIELHNITDEPVKLWDPGPSDPPWAVSSDGYFFERLPGNTTIPAKGYLLLIQADPELFRAKYSVPDDVPIVAVPTLWPVPPLNPEIYLLKTSGLSGGAPRYVAVEHIAFKHGYPWPPGPLTDGHSLERIDSTAYGNDPRNWRESPTISSPGRPNSGISLPQVFAGTDQILLTGSSVTLQGSVSDDSGPGGVLSSEWSQVSGPAPAEFSQPALDSVTVRFPTAGRYVVRLTATNGTGSASDVAVINVADRLYDAWSASNFDPVDLQNPLVSGPTADPERDGLRNDMEFFFGSLPKAPDNSNPVQIHLADGHWQMTWRQRGNASDILAVPEHADRLEGPWIAGEEFFTRSELPQGEFTQVTLREKLPALGRTQGFFRLRLSLK